MDRYYQVVRCFRDEDLRADRQPEFTQIDIETSFLDRDDLLCEMEQMMAMVFGTLRNVTIPTPFPRLTYQESMERYGVDNPDVRYGLELVDVTDIAKQGEFKVFAEIAQTGGKIKGINVKGGGEFSRKDIDLLTDVIKPYGAKGLSWFKVTADGSLQSSMTKFFTPARLNELNAKFGGQPNDRRGYAENRGGGVGQSA